VSSAATGLASIAPGHVTVRDAAGEDGRLRQPAGGSEASRL